MTDIHDDYGEDDEVEEVEVLIVEEVVENEVPEEGDFAEGQRTLPPAHPRSGRLRRRRA